MLTGPDTPARHLTNQSAPILTRLAQATVRTQALRAVSVRFRRLAGLPTHARQQAAAWAGRGHGVPGCLPACGSPPLRCHAAVAAERAAVAAERAAVATKWCPTPSRGHCPRRPAGRAVSGARTAALPGTVALPDQG